MKSRLYNYLLLPFGLVVLFACNQPDDTLEAAYNTKGELIEFNPPIQYCSFYDMEDLLVVESHVTPILTSYLPVNAFASLPVAALVAEQIPLEKLCLFVSWFSYDRNSGPRQPDESFMQKVIEIHEEYKRFPLSSGSVSATSPFLIYYGHHYIQELKILFIPNDSNVPIDVTNSVTIHSGHPYLGAIVSEDENSPLCIPWPGGMSIESYVAFHPLLNGQLFCVFDPQKTDISGRGHFCVKFTFTDGSVRETEEENSMLDILR